MSAIDDFNKVKDLRDYYANSKWCGYAPRVRLFAKDTQRTIEHQVTSEDTALFEQAVGLTEHEYSSEISYCGSYIIGDALQKCVLYYLDNKLKTLAQKAKNEAEAILNTLKP